jgi:hypothetical protein
MDINAIWIGLAILSFANLGLTARLYWGLRRVRAKSAAPVAVAAGVAPVSAMTCSACRHVTRTFAMTPAGPVCAKCQPSPVKTTN